MKFRVRFVKEFTLVVEGESLDAVDSVVTKMSDREIYEMGAGCWNAPEVWTATKWDLSRPEAVVMDGKLVHPDDAKGSR